MPCLKLKMEKVKKECSDLGFINLRCATFDCHGRM